MFTITSLDSKKIIENKNKIIELYNNNKGCNTIGKILNIKHDNIYYFLKKWKINIRSKSHAHQKYAINEHYFDKIDTEEKAYWLGFIAADGCICHKTVLLIEISQEDKNHLYKFIKSISSSHPIKDTRKNCCRVEIGNEQLAKSLNNLGIVPNKSHILIQPNINSNLLRHFYRGILDGDGWITFSKPNKNRAKRGYQVGFSSASEIFIHQIKDWVCSNIQQECGSLIYCQRTNGSCYQLCFGGNKIFPKIFNLFYNNATIYLDRKYEKAIDAIKNIDIYKKLF